MFCQSPKKFYYCKSRVNIPEINTEPGAEARKAPKFLKFLSIFLPSVLTNEACII